jgi:hypothetical protein
MSKKTGVKKEAKELIDALPNNATWDDVMYRMYVRKKLEKAVKEAEKGPWIPHEKVKRMILGR